MYDNELDFYKSYNSERYIHFRFVPTGNYEFIESKRNGEVVYNRKPILEKQKLSFEEVKQLNLDNYGQDVRTAADDFTLIHNYLMDFWSAIMGSDPVMLYIHLKRYCFQGKDFCFPNMSTIRAKMKKGSQATINKNIEILEEHGFIAKINRIDKERNNGYSGPFFKVRRYVPLLSIDLIDKLPKELQKEHDKFLAKANGIELNENFDTDKFLDDLMKSSELMKSKNQKEKEKELIRKGRIKDYIVSQMSKEEVDNWMIFLKNIEDKVSKPSFDTWFTNSILFVNTNQKSIKIYAPNNFVSDWLMNQYKELILNIVENTFFIDDIKYFECNLYEHYNNDATRKSPS